MACKHKLLVSSFLPYSGHPNWQQHQLEHSRRQQYNQDWLPTTSVVAVPSNVGGAGTICGSSSDTAPAPSGDGSGSSDSALHLDLERFHGFQPDQVQPDQVLLPLKPSKDHVKHPKTLGTTRFFLIVSNLCRRQPFQ